jgi:hypothetical protein
MSHKSDNNIVQKLKRTSRRINEITINGFHNHLSLKNWNHIIKITNVNTAYDTFLNEFQQLYYKAFPETTKFVKTKTLLNPWITQGILKSSKRKQRLYNKFIKKRTLKNEINYKNYKRLYESVLRRSKKSYYSEQLNKHNKNTQKMWSIIKEVIGKKN